MKAISYYMCTSKYFQDLPWALENVYLTQVAKWKIVSHSFFETSATISLIKQGQLSQWINGINLLHIAVGSSLSGSVKQEILRSRQTTCINGKLPFSVFSVKTNLVCQSLLHFVIFMQCSQVKFHLKLWQTPYYAEGSFFYSCK